MSDKPASDTTAPPGAAAGLASREVRRPDRAGEADGLVAAAAETDLVAQAAAGDPAAFDRLVFVHQQRIARLVQRLLGWRGEVDDVVQDVFVDVLQNLARFDGRSRFDTWLVRVAINRCRSHQRRQWARHGLLQRLRSFLPLPRGQGRGEGAGAALEADESVRQVRTAIAQLRRQDREVIVLRYLEELPADEIAKMLNLSRNAVDVRLTRARKRLETILKPLIDPN